MATGVKISALPVATSFDSTDLMPIVEGGVTKSVTHDVLMDDTQICKAWVNFNGTGTVAIRDDFNVSSITDEGTGDYTVNFTNNLSDALFSTFAMASEDAIGSIFMSLQSTDGAAATSSVRVKCYTDGGTVNDRTTITVQVFGS